MKTVLCTMLLLCASAAFGQAVGTSSVSAQPQVYSFEGHPLHAERVPMAATQDINGGIVNAYGQGERPLWEVAQQKHEMPLGDLARTFRAERVAKKKAVMNMQNW